MWLKLNSYQVKIAYYNSKNFKASFIVTTKKNPMVDVENNSDKIKIK